MYIKSYPQNQYGFGSWLKKNAGWLAPVVGGVLAPLTGGASMAAGAAIGSAVGAPISQAANMDEAQALQEKQRQEMIQQQQTNNQLSQLPEQKQYSSTFANGGIISSYQGGLSNGGGINQSSGLPNVTMYKNGGTHQQNPLGGVPLGKTGNSVEEGEVRFGDYIFSNRF